MRFEQQSTRQLDSEARLNVLSDVAEPKLVASAGSPRISASSNTIGTNSLFPSTTRNFTESESNDSIFTADNVGGILLGNGDRQTRAVNLKGRISNSSDQDFYRILTGTQGAANLELKAAPNTRVTLYRDFNFNGVVEAGEQVVTTTSSVQIDGISDSGELFVKVNRLSGTAGFDYTATVIAQAGQANESESNNTASSADLLGSLAVSRSIRGAVNSSFDRNDFFNFRLETTRQVSMNLIGRSSSGGNADLRLYRDANLNGLIDANELVAVSAKPGPTSDPRNTDQIIRNLGAGSYFIEVFGQSGSVSQYDLNVGVSRV